MAIKGRPLVKKGYEQELSSVKAFVAMQNKSESNPSINDHVRTTCVTLQPSFYVTLVPLV